MVRLRRLSGRPTQESVQAWIRAVERLRRAVQRYHDKAAMTRDRRVRAELLHIAEALDSALADVIASSGSLSVRAGRNDVALHAVTRAATLTAHATEAAMMAADAQWHREYDDVRRCLDTVRTLVKAVRELADACRPPAFT